MIGTVNGRSTMMLLSLWTF